MKVSYKWLKNYVDLSNYTLDEITQRLTHSGFEVEGVTKACTATNLVIGFVVDCIDHPDSDHLHITQVDIGEEQLQIVCGAPNVAKGQKVIVAKVGAVLPAITIKQGNIRGQASSGMICSLLELGVDKRQLREDQLQGIEVLGDDAIVGQSPLEYLGLDDTIIDVSITPNRSDCNSFFSFCQEVGAIMNTKVNIPEITNIVGENTALTIESTTSKCPLFLGRVIKGIKIGPSPRWIKELLAANGIKSINNVVDISNLVMIETGQPMHFYDMDCLPHLNLTCSNDYAGDYLALDGLTYQLGTDDLVIKSRDVVVGIAGVMGGNLTKVTDSTVNLVLESANFNLASIRLTSRRLNLMSEAALRFSKAISAMQTYQAMDRATWLLKEYAAAQVIEKTVVHDTLPAIEKTITLTTAHCNQLLNTDFTTAEVASVMSRLQFEFKVANDAVVVSIPNQRQDINIKEDLVEEVVRILGFDRVKAKLPLMPTIKGNYAANQVARHHIKDILVGEGFYDLVTYSLVSNRHLEHASLKMPSVVTLANPWSDERKYYRTSLLPSILDVATYNTARFQSDFGFFEIGNVYDDENNQNERLALVISNKRTYSRWQKIEQQHDFYYLKGLLLGIIKQLGFDDKRVSFVANDLDTINYHPGQSAIIYLDKTLVGVFGNIHPQQQKAYDLGKVALAEINLTSLYQTKAGKLKYAAISRYPGITYDLAMIVKKEIPVAQLLEVIKKPGKALISKLEVFDVYQGDNIPSDSKSVAISVTFQVSDRTLSDKDIQPVIQQITNDLAKQCQAIIRDK